MSSPASEIVVSKEPPPSSPPQSMERIPTPEKIIPEPPTSPPADPNSKKSFKRKYRKLLNKYLKIRATNQSLHDAYSRATETVAQLSNETANLLDFMAGLNPASPPTSPPADEEFDPPSPSKYSFDAHFGYTPSPSPPPEVANLLTQEQIDMGMYKVDAGSGAAGPVVSGSMGPPQLILREDIVDTFKGRGVAGAGGRGARTSATLPSMSSAAAARRKRKDRDSEGEEPSIRKKRA